MKAHPSHLRYLLERLKQRLPNAPILVGLWPMEDAILNDETLRRQMGADYYTSSQREAVNAYLTAARSDTPAQQRSSAMLAAVPA